MLAYTSIESHGIHTPEGEKVQETIINVENGTGTKTLVVKDEHGMHSDTMPLKPSEMKNIEKRRFMPNLFNSSMKNIKALKSGKSGKRAKTAKKGHKRRKSHKKAKGFFGLL